MDKMVMAGMFFGNMGRINCLLGKLWRSSHEGSYQEEVGLECVLGRQGASLVWVEAAEAWGCALEALVLSSPNKGNDIMHLMSRTTPASVALTLTIPPKKDWDGLLLSTVPL